MSKMKYNKKADGLPINVVVMMIIGLIIFGLGFAMFSKFADKGEERISDLENQIKSDIASLQCDGGEWICFPSSKMKLGEKKVFQVYVSNQGEVSDKFFISFDDLVDLGDNKWGISKDDCGKLIIYYPNIEVMIQSGESASFPVQVISTRVKKQGCSFVTSVSVKAKADNTFLEKTSFIVRVE